ncbi:hypothetical protein CQY20_26125 [Mycolicibacterium agri]|uniref:Uncharacterized protein n=1 Tax=Mycolicibacterium agri TaxID=36811 RepID=A0A2A7MRI9_MYCAG|nr:hypothetical protein [Mycolicibacterium agri]PEG34345.1 hypothetical protein CQY20_26125 [Mycolicibacterium agri]GFG49441.1 hypothetical protein MAGR_08820 [Mycolicibacterium agri]
MTHEHCFWDHPEDLVIAHVHAYAARLLSATMEGNRYAADLVLAQIGDCAACLKILLGVITAMLIDTMLSGRSRKAVEAQVDELLLRTQRRLAEML